MTNQPSWQQGKATGQELFDKVVKTIGLRETWCVTYTHLNGPNHASQMLWHPVDLFSAWVMPLVSCDCVVTGLRYFDVSYIDSTGMLRWVRRQKKLLVQDVARTQPVPFQFLAKFYPEDVAEEVIQPLTQHLFFLQVKQVCVHANLSCERT